LFALRRRVGKSIRQVVCRVMSAPCGNQRTTKTPSKRSTNYCMEYPGSACETRRLNSRGTIVVYQVRRHTLCIRLDMPPHRRIQKRAFFRCFDNEKKEEKGGKSKNPAPQAPRSAAQRRRRRLSRRRGGKCQSHDCAMCAFAPPTSKSPLWMWSLGRLLTLI